MYWNIKVTEKWKMFTINYISVVNTNIFNGACGFLHELYKNTEPIEI